MQRNHRFYLLAVFCFVLTAIYSPAFCQEKKEEGNKYKFLRLAEYAFDHGNYYSAADNFLKARQADTSDASITYRLGETYSLLREYRISASWFGTSLRADSAKFPLARMHYARMLQMSGMYQEALAEYEDFFKTYADSFPDKYKSIAKREMTNCKFAIEAIPDTSVVVSRMSETVNSANSDFAPVRLPNKELLFSSLPSDSAFITPPGKKKIPPLTKLFVTTSYSSGQPERKLFDEGNFNSLESHTANGAFSPNGKRFYFTRCDEEKSGKIICSIFVSEWSDGKWSEPLKLGPEVNQPSFTSTHPNVATYKKNEVLFFASDRPGGQGGMDIWFSLIQNQKLYLPAANLGPKINTPETEVTPYFSDSLNALFFSSDGWKTVGGLDILKSSGTVAHWKTPENIGLPFNSPADDFYFVPPAKDSSGYFVSNRADRNSENGQTCCDDIFHFGPLPHFVPVMHEPIVLAVTGWVFDEDDSTRTPLDGAGVFLSKEALKDFMNDTVRTNKRFCFALDTNTSYQLRASKMGYDTGTVSVSTVGLTRSDTLHADIFIARNPRPLTAHTKIEKDKTYTLNNILYDFDDARLRNESLKELDKLYDLLLGMPESVIEISSHTDSCGSDLYNMRLSQKRAESVVNYLVKTKGIPGNRLVAKGFGKTRYIAPNSNPDGTDNPEGRQLNRRTDFKIIGELKSTVSFEKKSTP